VSASKRAPQLPAAPASGVRPIGDIRSQAAFVRTLLDEVERTTRGASLDAIEAQLVEELGRLGCRCVELAAELRALADAQARARADAHSATEPTRVA